MALATALSQFSIRKQILIGYLPVLLVLGFLAFTSYGNFKTFFQNFNDLSAVREENLTFLGIEKDVVELQRNVLVYSYVGYQGVLKKIEHLQVQLEKKFETVRPMVRQNEEINDRFMRMFGHYQDYKDGFEEAVSEKDALKDLKENKLEPLVMDAHFLLKKIVEDLREAKRFEDAYLVSQIERSLLQTDINIGSFESTPDALFIKNTSQLLEQMQADTELLKNKLTTPSNMERASEFLEVLEQYRSVFIEIITINRVYLHLVNVVLAGKAAEIDRLSMELDVLVNKRSQMLSQDLAANIQRSQSDYVSLSIIAGSIGVLSALLIAIGIANPVSAMAATLSQLAKGRADTSIPGQERKDEVGEMARAADEFKVMAERLEQQTNELEEFAYRTSHDLRSPLVSSIGVLKMTAESIENGDHDRAAKGVSLVQGSLEKLDALVQDILALAQAKNADEDIKDIDFEDIIDEAIMKFNHMDHYDRLDIQKDFQFDEGFKAPKSRIVLIVENLISNAIKYQDLEKASSFVKISTYKEHNNAVVRVEDNGLGVPEKHQDKLFLMFKRFHPRTSFGSGLGLYMMKKSADILRGDIQFEDTKNGSVFKLKVPIS